jgi:hypothetical protein
LLPLPQLQRETSSPTSDPSTTESRTKINAQTSFKDTIVDYQVGISDLNAKVHTYVVFGNDGTSPSFDPQEYGIERLSVMAVVCGDKLVSTRTSASS